MKNTLRSVKVAAVFALAISGPIASPVAALASNNSHSNKPATCKTTDIQISSRNTDLSKVSVTLKSSAAQKNVTCDVSLNSYKTDGPSWSTSGVQALIEHQTVTLTKDNKSAALTVQTAPCFGQNDLYIGSQKFDGIDGPLPKYPKSVFPTGLIAAWNGGKACADTTTPVVVSTDGCGDGQGAQTTPESPPVDQVDSQPIEAVQQDESATIPVVIVDPKIDQPAVAAATDEIPHILATATVATAPATLPATIPATGAQDSSYWLLLLSAFSAFAYGATYVIREKLNDSRSR